MESNVHTYLATVENSTETCSYFGIVNGLKGAYTCGDTIDELMHNLHEVIELVLDCPPGSFCVRIDSLK